MSLLPVTLACLMAGCAQTKFKAWRGGGVERGPGGACETVAGVEVWTHGRPDRPFTVVGLIEDSRPGGVIPMARRLGTVARMARDKGADGIIVMAEGKEYRGTFSTANAFTRMNAETQFNANTRFHPWNSATTTGNAYTTGSAYTSGTGMSVAITQAHGTYQVFRYAK